MGILAGFWSILSRWYVAALVISGLGVLAGYLVFFIGFPGRPQVGVINVPFTVIDDISAANIGELLDYARTTESIRAVVIKLDSPGGFVAASDQLFLKMLKLREAKPVVFASGSIVASGGYLISLGANYIYAKPSSFVGNVGVVFFQQDAGPSDERLIFSGPAKLTGSTQLTSVRMVELIKQNFIQTVLAERGERLRMSREQLAEGRLYLGAEGVQLGLVDAIGTDADAIDKAAELAGISRYDLVDVNEKVLRECILKIRRILAPSDESEAQVQLPGIGCSEQVLPANDEGAQAPLSDNLPVDVTLPQMYYLYVPPSE